MNATTTPGSGGTTRRRFPVVVIPLLIIGISLVVFGGMKATADDKPKQPKVHAIVCDDNGMAKNGYQRVIIFQTSEIAAANKVIEKGSTTQAQKAIERRDVAQVRLDDANFVKLTCLSGDAPATTAPPSVGDPDGCGVNYRPYEVAGTNRFGPEPVAVASSADLDKVKQAWLGDLKDNPYHTAIQRQGRYLVDGGISTGEVQAKAEYYKANPAEWRKANADLRARLGRARLELVKVSGSYQTQEAILDSNPCVAPAAKDVSSSGDRWLLRVHLSKQDGGRVVDLVIFCRWQIHEQTPQGQAPPATAVPSTHGTTPPATVPPTSPPPTTAPPTTAPPTTAPPTTAPPTTAPPTIPPKVCGGPGQPSCTGTPSR